MYKILCLWLMLMLAQPAFGQTIRERLKEARQKERIQRALRQKSVSEAKRPQFRYYNDVAHLNWKKDPQDGTFKAFFAPLELNNNRDAGKAEGIYREFHDNGRTALEKEYRNGILRSSREFDKHGLLRKEEIFFGTKKRIKGIRRVYNAKGKLVKSYPINRFGLKKEVDLP